MSRQILSGWKEISRHIGRSVRTIQRWESWLDMPVYRPALKDRSAVMAFSDELDRWISRASPARDEDAVLNGEIVLQVLKDMSGLVGNISGRGTQMQLWPELLPQPIEFYHTTTAPTAGANAASVANRGAGLVLAFRPRKAVLHSDNMDFEPGVRDLIDERGSAPSPHSSIANESSRDLIHGSPKKKNRYIEMAHAILSCSRHRPSHSAASEAR
jgi:hypothetical protein